MKDSGVEWIGEIPVDWEVTKLNRAVGIITDYVASGSFADLAENVTYLDNPNYAMLVRIADLSGTRDKPVYIDKKAYEFLSNSNLFGGEVILSNIGSVGSVFIYHKMYEHASLAPNSIMLDQSDDNRFVYYWFMNPMTNVELKRIGGNAVQAKFNKTQLRQFKIVLPPSEEQHRIADYLDRKCDYIDAYIGTQEKLIKKLKAYKQAVITETITKGLGSDIEMKNSGIEFIGEIPFTWKVCRLRNIGVPQNGISKGGEFFGYGYPFVSYGDVYRNYTLPIHINGLVDTTDNERKDYSVEKGDIFFTRTSETIEEVGFSCVCEETIPNATFAGFIIRVRPFDDTLYTGYSKYYFRSSHHRAYLVKEMNLVTRASLGQDLLKSMPVLIPPMEEQKKIAKFLDRKCSAIDDAIKTKEKIIDKFIAYKKSLIYEVVTGKKEVI